MKNITVIGSGVMGSGIALAFASKGCRVVLHDIGADILLKAKTRITADAALLAEEGALMEQEKRDTLASIVYCPDLAEAVKDADMVIEAIPEVIELKWQLFDQLETLLKPHTIIASNTSTFPITKLMEKASFAERMVIAHFFNPGHLVPLVEIIQHEQTDQRVLENVINLLRSIGKAPVLLKKEIAGFIGNRLQTALMREAFHLLEEGIADAEGIDTAITAGPGFRWSFTGPIEIADLGGLDTWQRVFDNVAPTLNNSKGAPELIRSLAEAGKLGLKSGEGIFHYDEAAAARKINERDRHFIRLGKIKTEKEEVK
ncbi:3-hydroxyacyl-CoA dehydrogenase family protein [Bacillus massiliglaciei]|uniref:3-hydroxyacyl-CoA dehydrogenase family protein n=1 Tax=Bacillus massiliglaciei TaxID=1816693 RepID=UPI000DA63724|nr:3-hydroxyacyl-CoA dehydrogenase family protein [Bacillus massiliglaciei]